MHTHNIYLCLCAHTLTYMKTDIHTLTHTIYLLCVCVGISITLTRTDTHAGPFLSHARSGTHALALPDGARGRSFPGPPARCGSANGAHESETQVMCC
jgi:hypothetical protein